MPNSGVEKASQLNAKKKILRFFCNTMHKGQIKVLKSGAALMPFPPSQNKCFVFRQAYIGLVQVGLRDRPASQKYCSRGERDGMG